MSCINIFKIDNIKIKYLQFSIWIKLRRYKRMLKKCAKIPYQESFYCLPADEKDLPLLSGDTIEMVGHCSKCQQAMKKRIIERGCSRIEAFYCKKDNIHWIFDNFGIVPPRKWYGPFSGYPDWTVAYVYQQWKFGLLKK